MAGEISQKFVNYRIKLAMTGYFSKFKGKFLEAFAD